MSTTAQGPGWWQASDGNWYPPAQHPARQVPFAQQTPGYGYGGPAGPRPETNGMAVASFVLSLVWIAGLGSLLAIIFALVARKSIRDARGSQSGDGFAIAGLVIGILGLLVGAGLIVLLIVVRNDVSLNFTPTNVSMGTKVAVGDPANTGITAVTVQSLTVPVAPGGAVPPAVGGKEYAVAKVEICAGADGSQHATSNVDFTLGFADGGATPALLVPVESPDIGNISGLAAHACATGYVSFAINRGTKLAYVGYLPGLIHQYQWRTAK